MANEEVEAQPDHQDSVTRDEFKALDGRVEKIENYLAKLPASLDRLSDKFESLKTEVSNHHKKPEIGLGQIKSSTGRCYEPVAASTAQGDEDDILYALKEVPCEEQRSGHHHHVKHHHSTYHHANHHHVKYHQPTHCHPSLNGLSAGLLGTWFGMGNWFASPISCSSGFHGCGCVGRCRCVGTHC